MGSKSLWLVVLLSQMPNSNGRESNLGWEWPRASGWWESMFGIPQCGATKRFKLVNITRIKYSHIYHKTIMKLELYMHQLSYQTGAPHCRSHGSQPFGSETLKPCLLHGVNTPDWWRLLPTGGDLQGKWYHRCPCPIGWLFYRGVCLPMQQQVNDDCVQSSHRPTPIFTQRTLLYHTLL